MIFSYHISFKISGQRLEEYLNWKYGFFTFSDTVEKGLTGENQYSMRIEIKNGMFFDDKCSHESSLIYDGKNIDF